MQKHTPTAMKSTSFDKRNANAVKQHTQEYASCLIRTRRPSRATRM